MAIKDYLLKGQPDEKMEHNMKTFIKKQGFTLVELIISFAILGIIAITFLAIFSGMYKGISNAGNKSKAAFSAQGNIDNSIATRTDGTDTMTIQFNGNSISLTGRTLTSTVTSGNTTVTVSVYTPNN